MSYEQIAQEPAPKRKQRFLLHFLCSWALLGVLLAAPVAQANASMLSREEVVAYIERSVNAFARSINSHSVDVTVDEFKIPGVCDTPVKMELSDPSRPVGRMTLTLICEQPRYWKTRVKAQSAVTVDMVVAKKPLKRGQSIQGGDLSSKAVNIAYVRYSYFTEKKKLIGKVVSRNVSAGRVLTPRLVEMPEWVKRDDVVIIEARRDNMLARMKGIALESGSEGDTIRVKNITSEKEIQATVSAPGTVSTTF
ncbi:flagellar basal body P-ring formation protein FlgA [Enterovibrio sp. ZSDZ42]|uniref:Flagella basal body P-ring formation protein FlgA n=1 Tax=Enterovibrio gelatinilyticus TaxID=2899819 RepID=A0ABT5R121_9GAMM|nr:flagellar basal body P-ring formation chaperone FlgA [Enterovibrio sp. ZSDZ42]MDD1793555.1 flagellar basal body P-ring formation protein FlgA [Enterovibrio sp. ZSDZ42]